MASTRTPLTSCLFHSILLVILLVGSVRADDFHDPKSVGWKFRYGLSDAEYAKAWDDYKKEGYLPIDIETGDNGKTYSGVWQKNTDGRGWASWRRLTSDSFHEKWEEYSKKGYRPIDQDAELIGGELLYSLIMVENKENLKWISRRNLTNEQFSAEFAKNKGAYRPINIDAIEVNKTMFYSVIWLENKANLAWAEFRDMTPDDYGKKFTEYKDKGYRVAELACYKRDGKLNYAAIWEKNEPGRAWAALREMSATGLRNHWYKYSDQGMRVIDIAICPAESGGGSEYAAVWRENDDRYDWPGRAQAEKILAGYVANPGIPGVGAAIVRNGQVVFRGGAGFADKDKNLEAHGRTIYRLASVAKAVTGTLAYDMEQAKLLDLDSCWRGRKSASFCV